MPASITVDAPTAALIGAGAASIVSIGTQYFAHRLALRRDRRNQYRQRLYSVIVDAASALYEPRRANRPPPDANAPKHGTQLDIYLAPRYRAFADAAADALTLLMIHFGHDHAIIDKYVDTWAACGKANALAADDEFGEDDDEARQLVAVLRGAQQARDKWMREAREYVNKM